MTVRVDFNTGTVTQPVWSDITPFVREVSFSRGKDDQIGAYSAGECSIVLDNRGAEFDPTNTSSPYAGKIVPRGQVRVFSPYSTQAVSRTNLIPNPSFQGAAPTSGWVVSGGSISSATGGVFPSVTGSFNCLECDGASNVAGVVATNTFTAITITAGETYTFSIYFGSAETDVRNATVSLFWYNTSPSSPIGTTSTTIDVSASVWQRLVFTAVAPVGANAVQPSITMAGTGTDGAFTATAPTFYLDGALLELGTEQPYFDGSFTDDPSFVSYAWVGTANASQSTATGVEPVGYQYVGYVTDWDLNYEVRGDATATVKASDVLSVLANQTLLNTQFTVGDIAPGKVPSTNPAPPVTTYPDISVPYELSGARVNRMLDASNVAFVQDRSEIDAGREYMAAETTDRQNLLSYLQQVEAAEGGRLFAAKDGNLRFVQADATNPIVPPTVTFTDDGTGIKFERLEVVYGSEQLANQVTATYLGNEETPEIVADNFTSQTAYGVTAQDLGDLLTTDPQLATYLAASYANRYGEPVYRIEALTVNLRALTSLNRATVEGLELADTVAVSFTAPGNPTPIEQTAEIVRISREISEGTFSDYITFGFNAYLYLPFVLNSSTMGKLDNTTFRLGF